MSVGERHSDMLVLPRHALMFVVVRLCEKRTQLRTLWAVT